MQVSASFPADYAMRVGAVTAGIGLVGVAFSHWLYARCQTTMCDSVTLLTVLRRAARGGHFRAAESGSVPFLQRF